MDVSETYIEMCEKAIEIQRMISRKAKMSGEHTVYCRGHHTLVSWVCGEFECAQCPDEWEVGDSIDGWVWLPRQDQLQEMCQPIAIDELIRRFFERYHRWFMSQDAPTACHVSMEQLWLAFVMKEKFGKVWNGEDWIDKV